MASKINNAIDPARLKILARGFLTVARDSDLSKLTAQQELEGRTVVVIIEREHSSTWKVNEEGRDVEEISVERDVEQVTVKVGTPSKQEIIVAAPASWLDEPKAIAQLPR